jgi:predicted DCC family thiol-disulfide oxidoreductase YuxK
MSTPPRGVPLRRVTVLFDRDCELCRRAKQWLAGQPQLVPLEFVPAGSERARTLFPGLDHAATLGDLTAVGDDGSVYVAESAWVLCLWCLTGYRNLAVRLAAPALLPTARRAVLAISARREHLSELLGGRPRPPIPSPRILPAEA